MPPDSIHITTQIVPDSIRLLFADSIKKLMDTLSTADHYVQDFEEKRPQFLLPQWQLFFIVLVILFVLLVYYVFLPGWLEIKKYKKKARWAISEKGVQYDYWLNRYNPYYKSLPPELKQKFLVRTAIFRESKEFRFHSMSEEEYIPILISGAAVQLTFGLKSYLLDFFSIIHVIKKWYYIPHYEDLYYGHVSEKGIHIAWEYFLQGFENYTDSFNVGLHEMAHALSYDAYLGYNDKDIKNRLKKFSIECGPIYTAIRRGDSHFLSDYATTNFDEFWAVSVESFFEDSEQLKEKMPQLYREISHLLNQDPLLPGKILEHRARIT